MIVLSSMFAFPCNEYKERQAAFMIFKSCSEV